MQCWHMVPWCRHAPTGGGPRTPTPVAAVVTVVAVAAVVTVVAVVAVVTVMAVAAVVAVVAVAAVMAVVAVAGVVAVVAMASVVTCEPLVVAERGVAAVLEEQPRHRHVPACNEEAQHGHIRAIYGCA
jgi:hypothetical protein